MLNKTFDRRPRVAVVGSGISGLSVAHALADEADVTLFEAADYFGGHTHTVAVSLEGASHGVDTGFLVCNERTYPQLLKLFDQLGVELAKADMSFSVQARTDGIEWSGSDLSAVFAQRANLLKPRFWAMLYEVLRFNRLATRAAVRADDEAMPVATQTVEQWLQQHRFGTAFREWYFLPMIGSIWSCPTQQMLRFPMATMLRFCHNHGLLQVLNRPQWFSVKGGAQTYVQKMLQRIADARLNTPVRQVLRTSGGVQIRTDARTELFDEVVLAGHSDQSLAILADASAKERAVLGSIGYQTNHAVLHTDTSVLPKHRRAWAAWNYDSALASHTTDAQVCLHYLINRLQPLPFRTPVIVSLNPGAALDPSRVLAEFDYMHPLFDVAAINAQQQLPAVQGKRNTWFCGAWTRYGFHEDGLTSGLAVVEGLRAAWAQTLQASNAAAAVL